MDQQIEAILREWYWTEKDKQTEIGFAHTLRKLKLYPYWVNELKPTIREVARGTRYTLIYFLKYHMHGWKDYNSEPEIWINWYNKQCPSGLSITYYDGYNCSINIWPLQITWRC